jgi:hypothetical protein
MMAAVGRFSGISPLFGLPVLRSEQVLCRAVQVPAAGVAGAGVVPRTVVFLVPGVIGGLCSTVQHLVLQVQPGDGLATSVGGGGSAPFRLRTHVVVGLELGGGRAPRGVGFCGMWAGYALNSWRWRPVAVVSMAVWGSCRRRGATLSSLPPLPLRHCLLLWAGRQSCDGEERRIWLLSGGVWRRHVGSSGPDGGARASGSGALQRLLPGLADERCGGATRGAAAARPRPWAHQEVVPIRAALRLLWQWHVIGPLDGSVWVGWAVTVVEVCFVLGSWPDAVLGRVSWAKALAKMTPLGAASPIEGVVFPSFVLRGRKPGPPRTGDDGVLDVTPFPKASLLKFVSTTSSPSVVAFVFRAPVCVWRWRLAS